MKHFKNASIGGTFHAFHKGHRNYINIAFGVADFVHIYLTSDHLAKKRKSYIVHPFEKRRRKLVAYLDNNGWSKRYVIVELNSQLQLQRDLLEKRFDVVVVEPAYYQEFNEINRKRNQKFCLLYKPRDIDRNGNDISSTLFENVKKVSKP